MAELVGATEFARPEFDETLTQITQGLPSDQGDDIRLSWLTSASMESVLNSDVDSVGEAVNSVNSRSTGVLAYEVRASTMLGRDRTYGPELTPAPAVLPNKGISATPFCSDRTRHRSSGDLFRRGTGRHPVPPNETRCAVDCSGRLPTGFQGGGARSVRVLNRRESGERIPPGSIWATLPDSHALWRIDPQTNRVTRIPIPYFPWGVAAADDEIWVAVRAKP